jgi:hypothetical protein
MLVAVLAEAAPTCKRDAALVRAAQACHMIYSWLAPAASAEQWKRPLQTRRRQQSSRSVLQTM